MYSAIAQFLNQFVDFNDKQLKAFKEKIEIKDFKKGDILLSEGQRCDFIAFINTGAFRYYNFKEGKEYNGEFFFENSFFTDYISYLTDKKSKAYLQAIEDSTILILKKNDIFDFYKTEPKFVNFGRLMAENNFIKVTSKNKDILLMSFDERYKKLVRERPEVIQRVPQYMIASYLGITPEALSRIRKRLYNE